MIPPRREANVGAWWPREKETVNGVAWKDGRDCGGEGGEKERNRGGKVEAVRGGGKVVPLAGRVQGKCSCGAWPAATPDPPSPSLE